jgi:hypothetical protein
MKTFRPRTNRELAQALAHLHFMTRVFFAETKGDEIGEPSFDPSLPTTNRFIDYVQAHDADGPCRIERETGSATVVAALLAPDGVYLLLEPAPAIPLGEPKP